MEISATDFGSELTVGVAPTAVTAGSTATVTSAGTNGYFIFDNAGADAEILFWDPTGGNGSDAVAVAKLQGVSLLLPADFHVV